MKSFSEVPKKTSRGKNSKVRGGHNKTSVLSLSQIPAAQILGRQKILGNRATKEGVQKQQREQDTRTEEVIYIQPHHRDPKEVTKERIANLGAGAEEIFDLMERSTLSTFNAKGESVIKEDIITALKKLSAMIKRKAGSDIGLFDMEGVKMKDIINTRMQIIADNIAAENMKVYYLGKGTKAEPRNKNNLNEFSDRQVLLTDDSVNSDHRKEALKALAKVSIAIDVVIGLTGPLGSVPSSGIHQDFLERKVAFDRGTIVFDAFYDKPTIVTLGSGLKEIRTAGAVQVDSGKDSVIFVPKMFFDKDKANLRDKFIILYHEFVHATKLNDDLKILNKRNDADNATLEVHLNHAPSKLKEGYKTAVDQLYHDSFEIGSKQASVDEWNVEFKKDQAIQKKEDAAAKSAAKSAKKLRKAAKKSGTILPTPIPTPTPMPTPRPSPNDDSKIYEGDIINREAYEIYKALFGY